MDLLIFEGAPERIDTYLSKKLGYSRSFFHHILSRNGIKVNDKPIKKSYKLKQGDQIEIDNLKRYFGSEILSETPKIDIPIVLEKEDYMIINKPKGVLSHPNSVWDLSTPSVVGFLYHKFKDLPSIGDFIRAGILHRLDKGTDGLMIIAKTEKGLAHFKKLFQQKSESESLESKEATKLKKFYRATCYVTEKGKKFLDEIKNNLPHYIQEIVHAKVPNSVPKLGITKIVDYSLRNGEIEKLRNCGVVNLNLEILTGRTHQIRYHLSQKGLPIVGDWLYGVEDGNEVQLTAYKLVFEDLDGGIITVGTTDSHGF